MPTMGEQQAQDAVRALPKRFETLTAQVAALTDAVEALVEALQPVGELADAVIDGRFHVHSEADEPANGVTDTRMWADSRPNPPGSES